MMPGLAVLVCLAVATSAAWGQHHGGHGFGHHYSGHHLFGGHGFDHHTFGHHYVPIAVGVWFGSSHASSLSYGRRVEYYSAPATVSVHQHGGQAATSPPPGGSASQPPRTTAAGLDYQRRAESAFRDHHYDDAVRQANHAAVEMPRNGYTFQFLSQVLFAVGDYRGAGSAAHQAMYLLDPGDWGWVVKNFRRYYHDADYKNQVRRLEKFRRENPNNPDALFLLGYHYGFLGYPREARRELARAVELDDRDTLAISLLERFGGQVPPRPAQPAVASNGIRNPGQGGSGSSRADAAEYPPPQFSEDPKGPGGHNHKQ